MWIDTNLFEVLSCLFGRPRMIQDVLVHEVLDPDFARPADIETDLAVTIPVGIRNSAAGVAATKRSTIELRLHAVLGQQYLDRVVVAGDVDAIRTLGKVGLLRVLRGEFRRHRRRRTGIHRTAAAERHSLRRHACGGIVAATSWRGSSARRRRSACSTTGSSAAAPACRSRKRLAADLFPCGVDLDDVRNEIVL